MKSPYASRITGTGSAFPKKVVTNNDLAKHMDTNDEWIRERTGIRERRIVEQGNEGEDNSSLAAQAAMKALEMAGKKPEDIDTIIFGTCSPDTLVPSSACWLQKKLGAVNACAMDVNAACSGFVYALSMGDNFVKSGQSKCALIIGSEVLSPMMNWQDRTVSILFGDASGAAVIERTDADSPYRILSSHLGSDGNLWELFFVPAGGSKLPITHERLDQGLNFMQMKGKEIFKVAVKTLADYAVKALETNNVTKEDIKWLIPHQANLRIIEAVANRLDFPMEKVLVNVDKYGNTSAATTPTALDEAVRTGKINKGDLILFDVFGAGLTYGSLLLRWG